MEEAVEYLKHCPFGGNCELKIFIIQKPFFVHTHSTIVLEVGDGGMSTHHLQKRDPEERWASIDLVVYPIDMWNDRQGTWRAKQIQRQIG